MNENIKTEDIEVMEEWLNRKRPSEEMRPKLDYTYLLERNTFILCEIRPNYRTGKDWRKLPFAKIHYLKSKKVYKIYWQRASGKWLAYDDPSETESLRSAIKTIDDDMYGCFYG